MINSAIAVLFVACVLVAYYVRAGKRNRNASTQPLPKVPLIGDLHNSPPDRPLVNWSAWSKERGAITFTKLFGFVPVAVLNSHEAVVELFSRRSTWYSNRPSSVSLEMITGAGPGRSRFSLMHDYDDYLKLHHRILSPSLTTPAAPKYQPLMELEAKKLLSDLLGLVQDSTEGSIVSTKDIYRSLEHAQHNLILSLHYGLRLSNLEKQTLHELKHVQDEIMLIASTPRLPDMIPFLRYLPSLISPWKRYADKMFAMQTDLNMRLFTHGRDAPGWNVTKQAIALAAKHDPEGAMRRDLDISFTLATSLQGGSETTPRQLLWLFVAALLYPDAIARAHKVLDDTVGRDRPPSFSDRSNLAYIDAFTHELFRWRPIAPGGIPRRADRADEFGGVKFPKGTAVLANAWATSRDERVFDPALGDLQEFVPERWLRDDGKRIRGELPLPVFGVGRRMCQGKRVATDGAFLNVASLLWAFDFEVADGKEGEEVDPWAMVVVGFMTEPRAFRLKLKPRGEWVVGVVKREWEGAEKSLEDVMGDCMV